MTMYSSVFLSCLVAMSNANPYLLERQASDQAMADHSCFDPAGTARATHIDYCKPKFQMDKTGTCGPLTFLNGCTAYCQVGAYWDYGREIPFTKSVCAKNDACPITSTASVSFTSEFQFSIGGAINTRSLEIREGGSGPSIPTLQAAFNAGATWSWTDTYTNATAIGHTKPPIVNMGDGKCGYWTFVPYYVTSCGTLSTGQWTTVSNPVISASCENVKNVGNWCQTVPYVDANGAPGGATIFVAAHCEEHWALGFCWQDPVYLLPGIARNATVYDDYVLAHENDDIHALEMVSAKRLCLDGLPPFQYDDIDTDHRFWEDGGGSNKSLNVPKKD